MSTLLPRAMLLGLVLIVDHCRRPPAFSAEPAESVKIERLISGVENLKDATFIRNGRDHDARTAAKFLRGKRDAHKEEIHTAADFIAKAATRSSTTGNPYLIRFKDGREIACADHLNAELKRLETGNNP